MPIFPRMKWKLQNSKTLLSSRLRTETSTCNGANLETSPAPALQHNYPSQATGIRPYLIHSETLSPRRQGCVHLQRQSFRILLVSNPCNVFPRTNHLTRAYASDDPARLIGSNSHSRRCTVKDAWIFFFFFFLDLCLHVLLYSFLWCGVGAQL